LYDTCGYAVVYRSVWQPTNRQRTVGQNQSGDRQRTASFLEEENILLSPVRASYVDRKYFTSLGPHAGADGNNIMC